MNLINHFDRIAVKLFSFQNPGVVKWKLNFITYYLFYFVIRLCFLNTRKKEFRKNQLVLRKRKIDREKEIEWNFLEKWGWLSGRILNWPYKVSNPEQLANAETWTCCLNLIAMSILRKQFSKCNKFMVHWYQG